MSLRSPVMSLNTSSKSSSLCSAILRLPLRFHPTTSRHLSVLTRPSNTSTTNPSPSITPPGSPDPAVRRPLLQTIPTPTSFPTPTPLPWNEYLQLRRKRRHYNLFFSLTSALCTTGAGISILNQQNFDSLNLFGLDPFLILGLATAASGAVGWLLGPFLGNAVFGIVWRRLRLQIAAVSFVFPRGGFQLICWSFVRGQDS